MQAPQAVSERSGPGQACEPKNQTQRQEIQEGAQGKIQVVLPKPFHAHTVVAATAPGEQGGQLDADNRQHARHEVQDKAGQETQQDSFGETLHLQVWLIVLRLDAGPVEALF